MSFQELKEHLRAMSLLTTTAISEVRALELELRVLQKEVQSLKATQPYLVKRIGELTKKVKNQ